MVCKSCGATVREGQFTCSSCGAYLSKDTKVQTDSLEERSALLGGSDLYSHKAPVIINEGWKWYAFVTWGLLPIWSISNLLYVFRGFGTFFALGVIYFVNAVISFMAQRKLADFSEGALPLLYAALFSPLYIFFVTYLYLKKQVGEYINVEKLFTSDGAIMSVTVITIIFAIINIVYFQNRKDEFQY